MKYSWVVRHPIPLNGKIVFDHLDERLFEVLQPPKWMAKIIRNDGVEQGDEIWVKLLFPIPGLWKTQIIKRDVVGLFFTDESKAQLPIGMRYWKHIHRVVHVGENSCRIEEDIEWESSNHFLGFFLNIGFRLMMTGRRKMYQKYFEKIAFTLDNS